MANYTKATNFASKDSLLTGNPSKLVRGSEIDAEFNAISTAIATKADTNSPNLTGTPTAPTASSGTNSTQIATTAFVSAVFPTQNNTYSGTQTFLDNKFEVADNSDTSKKFSFELSGVTTATTRTLTVPDKSGTLALTSDIASVATLNTVNNTIVTGSYSVSGSSTITITATHAFSVNQEVFITFTNTSGSALTAAKFTIVSVTGTTSFTINYGSTVTSAGTVQVERYGLIAVANSSDMAAGTSLVKAVTPKQFKDFKLVSKTSVNASGSSVDFTDIPSWVKRVTVMLSGVSTSGSSELLVQLGTSSGVTTSGYTSASSTQTGSTTDNSTAGFIITAALAASASTSGLITICLVDLINTWVSTGLVRRASSSLASSAGTVSLAAVLDRVRVTTVNGTDTFDAGIINIMYE